MLCCGVHVVSYCGMHLLYVLLCVICECVLRSDGVRTDVKLIPIMILHCIDHRLTHNPWGFEKTSELIDITFSTHEYVFRRKAREEKEKKEGRKKRKRKKEEQEQGNKEESRQQGRGKKKEKR